MKKPRKYFQQKEQNKCPERTNKERDLTDLLELVFKKEVIKILKKFKKHY